MMLYPLFLYIRKRGSGNLQKWGKVCNVADLPPGERMNEMNESNERGKICNISNLPLGGRSAMLQIFQGKVCYVADLPGGRSARGKVCNTTPAISRCLKGFMCIFGIR